MGFETGIALPYVAAPVEQDALASMRPLQLGANPVQIQAMAPWQVPETKPYIAQGIAKAMETIGAGIKARYEQKREDKKETARATLEKDKLNEQIRHNKAIEQATNARINAVASGKLKEAQQWENAMDDKDEDQGQPTQSNQATYTPSAPASVSSQGAALQGLPAVASAAPAAPVPPVVVFDGPPAVAPETLPSTSLAVMTPQEMMAAQEQEAALLKQQGVYGNLPLPEIESEKPKKEEKPVDPLTLGTQQGAKDNSEIEAVKEAAKKEPPALGDLGEPLLVTEDNKPKSALSKAPAIQKVNKSDMRVKFGNDPNEANEQARIFNKNYKFADVQAEVKEPSKSVPYWHIEYKDVAKERRAERRAIEEHAAAQELKREKLQITKDSKVTSMARAFEGNPRSKLMDVRKDAMERMITAVQAEKHARKDPSSESLSEIHTEMMDLFAQFASGKAPTEAQFHQVKDAYSGLSGWESIAKVFNYWSTGAQLTERDVQTMFDLMLNTYNRSASQTNAKLSNVKLILEDVNPNLKPYVMPVSFPLLKTKEFLTEQAHGEDLDKLEQEVAALKGEYYDAGNNRLKKEMPKEKLNRLKKIAPIVNDYFKLKQSNGIPANVGELDRFKKKMYGNKEYYEVPGFHSVYFPGTDGPPGLNVAIEGGQGHWQGSAE